MPHLLDSKSDKADSVKSKDELNDQADKSDSKSKEETKDKQSDDSASQRSEKKDEKPEGKKESKEEKKNPFEDSDSEADLKETKVCLLSLNPDHRKETRIRKRVTIMLLLNTSNS